MDELVFMVMEKFSIKSILENIVVEIFKLKDKKNILF